MTDREKLADDVQRFGLLSAAAVVDRYRQLVDGAVAPAEAGLVSGLELAEPSWLVDRASRLASGYLRFLEAAAAAIPPVDPVTAMEQVVVPAVPAGSGGEVSLWLHNTTAMASASIEIHCTALMSTGAGSIPTAAVTVTPERLDRLEPGSSAQLRLRVEVPADCEPGRYFGLVHHSLSPDEPLAVELEVAEEGP